jgi:O-antigen/teichoic acid export membrane protein
MISKKFLTSSLVYTIVSALPLASSVILLPFYTWYLKTATFGELAIYIAFTGLIQYIANFGMDGSVQVFYYDYKHNRKELNTYVGSMVSGMLISGTITIIISLLFGNLLFNVIFPSHDITFYPYGFMSVVTAFFNGFFKAYANLLVNEQKPLKFFAVNFFNFVLTIVISLGGIYYFKHTLVGPMWGRLLSGVGIFLLALTLFIREYGISINWDYIRKTVEYCFPLIVYLIITWALNYLDRYIINYFMTPSDVGIYDFTVRGTSLLDFVMMGLTTAIMPKIFSIWRDDKLKNNSPDVNRYFHSFSAITIVLVAGLILFLPVLIRLVIYNHSYYPAFKYIPLAALNYALRGIILIYYLPIYFFKKTKSLPWIFFFAALIQIPLTIILVKQYGLWGALWAAVLTKPVQAFFMYLESRKLIQFTYNRMKMIGMPVLYSIMVICGEIYLKSINQYLLHLAEMIITTAIIFLLFRKELVKSFQKIVLDDFLGKLKKN